MSEELTGTMLIAGRAHRGRLGEFRAVNARTGEAIEPAYTLGGAEEVREAAEAAEAAFDEYRSAPLEQRRDLLNAIADSIEEIRPQLLERTGIETGLPGSRILQEIGRTTGQLRMFADFVVGGSWADVRIEAERPDASPPRVDVRQMRLPLGPVAVFAASNFPMAFSVAGGDTAAALAAGCPVVVKAHSAHPGTSELVATAVAAAVEQVGLPTGVFSLLMGRGRELGIELVRAKEIQAVAFTGSRSGGLSLVDAAAHRQQPIPVYAEMSSINPVVLLPAALAGRTDDLARDFVTSLTGSAGQLCTNPGVLFVVGDSGEFLDLAAKRLKGVEAAPMLTPEIRGSYDVGVDRLVALDGVQLVARGAQGDGLGCSAALFETTAARWLAEPALQEEVFGASSIVVSVTSSEEVPALIAALEGQLTITLHADDDDLEAARDILRVAERKAGRVIFNGWPTGVQVGDAMVHGGPFPATSDGRSTSVGTLAIDRFLRPVAYQDLPEALRPAAIDPTSSRRIPRRTNGATPR